MFAPLEQPSHRRKRREAVTLLEVLMVVFVMTAAIGLAGVGPMFYTRSDLRSECELLKETLRLARETALLTQCEVTVSHDRARHSSSGLLRDRIQLIAAPGPFTDSADRFGGTPISGNEIMTDPIWLGERVRLRSDRSDIIFQVDGTADRDIRWTLNSGDDSLTISVQAVDARIIVGTP